MQIKLTITIDWSPPAFDCLPDKAQYITMDMDGTYMWWEYEPVLNLGYWEKSERGGGFGFVYYTGPRDSESVQIPMPIIRRD